MMKESVKDTIRVVGAIIVSILIFSVLVKTAEAKTVPLGIIEEGVSGTNICNLLEDGDKLVITSPGGSVRDALMISACVRSKFILVEVHHAFSAATFIVLASRSTCYDDKVIVGFHSPHRVDKEGNRVLFGLRELREYNLGLINLQKSWGYSTGDALTIVGITMITPHNKISTLSFLNMNKLLGTRYIGVCEND